MDDMLHGMNLVTLWLTFEIVIHAVNLEWNFCLTHNTDSIWNESPLKVKCKQM
jgi:hypothetical protein